ncbi:hypothetical protein ABZW13_19540, partial [Streptomyces sp. NPDC005549]
MRDADSRAPEPGKATRVRGASSKRRRAPLTTASKETAGAGPARGPVDVSADEGAGGSVQGGSSRFLVPPRGQLLVSRYGGEPAGTSGVRLLDDTTAELT